MSPWTYLGLVMSVFLAALALGLTFRLAAPDALTVACVAVVGFNALVTVRRAA